MSGPVSPIDPSRPIYQVIGEVNARIAKGEESSGIAPTWYVYPNESLADFFKRANERIDAIKDAKPDLPEVHEPIITAFDSTSWTGRHSAAEQRQLIRLNVPKALSNIAILADYIRQQGINNPIYINAIDDLRQNLQDLLALQEREVDWAPSLSAVATSAKGLLNKSDDMARYVKGSPTIMLMTFLMLCAVLGWNPIVALAGFFGIESKSPKPD